MDYNFWDDRTHELEINPCDGCLDYQDGECVSNGACGVDNNMALVKEIEILNQEFDELPDEEKIRFLEELENKE